MLSIAKISSGQIDYYIKLQREDYYLEGGEPPGRWLGQGAAALKLRGQVEGPAIHNLFNGYTPDGQRPLTQQQRYEGVHGGCGKVRQRQLGWDCTFSVPKSCSVAWAVAPPQVRHEIEAAVDAAGGKAVEYLQTHAAMARRGQGGCRREPVKLVAAVFPHSTSRELDPQYHLHCLIFNVAVRRDGSTGALESKPLYQHKMAAGSVFRNALAQELGQRLGLECQPAGDGFAIKGIPDQVCGHFSKRRAAITQRLAELGQHTAAQAAQATLTTRRRKGQVPPREQLLRLWQAEAQDMGLTPQAVTSLCRSGGAPAPQRETPPRPAPTPPAVPVVPAPAPQRKMESRPAPVAAPTPPTPPTAPTTPTKPRRLVPVPFTEPPRPPLYTSRKDQARQADLDKRVGRMGADQSLALPPAIVDQAAARYSQPRNAVVEEVKHHAGQIVRAARKQQTLHIPHGVLAKQAGQTLDRQGRWLLEDLTGGGRVVVVNHPSNEQREVALRAATEAWRKAGYEVTTCARSRRGAEALAQQSGAVGKTGWMSNHP